MTTTSQAAEQVQNGADVPATGLDAIERMYDEAKARIADMTGPSAEPAASDPWPETEEIDVGTIKPPPPGPPAMDRPATPRRPWLRWFTFRAWGAVAVR
jgi:hypothetical protein